MVQDVHHKFKALSVKYIFLTINCVETKATGTILLHKGEGVNIFIKQFKYTCNILSVVSWTIVNLD